jgi:SAM-dependent methyltransferase
MYEPNVARVLSMLGPADVVVDLGGWASPFNRANYVIDAGPYETRGYYATFGGKASQGGDVEHFTRERWIVRDLCGHEPYPFADKSVDFVICSHTLEDVRDPLRICAEMIRIAKRGYVEVPSRVWETCRGRESARTAGLSHHRWLIDIGDGRIDFLMKYHLIHSHWRYSLPASFGATLSDEASVQWLFWDESFAYEERTIHGLDAQAAELESFVARVRPYPAWRLAADRAASEAARVARGMRRRLGS